MQPLFHEPEPLNEGVAPLSRLIHFEIPSLPSCGRRKRYRGDGSVLPSSTISPPPFSSSSFSFHVPQGFAALRALRGFLEYGDRSHAAFTATSAELSWSSVGRLREGREEGEPLEKEGRKGEKGREKENEGDDGTSSIATVERLYRVALRQALALVCGVIAADSEGKLLLRAITGTSSSPSSPLLSSPPRGMVALYCALQGLGFELEDVFAQLASFNDNNHKNIGKGDTNAMDERKREELSSQFHRILRQVEQCVNAMEQTLIDIILPIPQDSDISSLATVSPHILHWELSYTSELFRKLGDIFKDCSWPFQLLAPSSSAVSTEPFSEAARGTGDSPGELTLLDLIPHSAVGLCSSEQAKGLFFRVGEGVTAILIAALSELRRELDGGNCLGIAPAAPLARLAAELPFQPSTVFASGRTVIRPAVDIMNSSFSTIEAKAWSGQYALVGLRRADLEMQAFFFKLFHSLGREVGSAVDELSTSSITTPGLDSAAIQKQRFRDLKFLWDRWNRSLEWHSAAFWQRLWTIPKQSGENRDEGNFIDADDSLSSLDLKHANVFNILASNKVESLTVSQQAALRVIDSLQSLDKKGWFRFPAFDLANFDFKSIMCWVQSPSFALKSNRAAFDALRRVLERMVDVCVRKYGPLHEYSECISSIRQQLVHAAQAGGLL